MVYSVMEAIDAKRERGCIVEMWFSAGSISKYLQE
jgi:hypothetical protein